MGKRHVQHMAALAHCNCLSFFLVLLLPALWFLHKGKCISVTHFARCYPGGRATLIPVPGAISPVLGWAEHEPFLFLPEVTLKCFGLDPGGAQLSVQKGKTERFEYQLRANSSLENNKDNTAWQPLFIKIGLES